MDITVYHLSLNVGTTGLIPVCSILYHSFHFITHFTARFPEPYTVMFEYGILKTANLLS